MAVVPGTSGNDGQPAALKAVLVPPDRAVASIPTWLIRCVGIFWAVFLTVTWFATEHQALFALPLFATTVLWWSTIIVTASTALLPLHQMCHLMALALWIPLGTARAVTVAAAEVFQTGTRIAGGAGWLIPITFGAVALQFLFYRGLHPAEPAPVRRLPEG